MPLVVYFPVVCAGVCVDTGGAVAARQRCKVRVPRVESGRDRGTSQKKKKKHPTAAKMNGVFDQSTTEIEIFKFGSYQSEHLREII